eukprot:TRINITY_DN16476_c0_g1::TRINITY_DN16476_c0_g1_i1::g.1800::m.1800 TRINITY_DN16476_c0_g1::TRINITY_DN16476_c0_g1_i1::g.1800  ORF type:complete len:399 (+),score=91.67,sp/Q54Y72/GACA_DICDI/39.78/2e-33,RhoGAP/PF00620.22/3.4e-24,WH1/PF00568.18/5e-09,WH1/PF00568.18/4.7e+03,WH1/PF00568.18/3.9e+03,PBD/PF00786.23/4.6e-05,L27_1/PF09058.5/52,L27_1/PF09058.5/32,L27_1/PF09058.5/1.5e+03 TRINITY_DN16476_c0_g1_i1:69-1265(+)
MPLKAPADAQKALEILGDCIVNDNVIMSTLVVLHNLEEGDWTMAEENWSTAKLLHNSKVRLFRVYIASSATGQLLLNTPLYDGLLYIEHSPDFHCWTTPQGETVGLSFLDSDLGAKFQREHNRALTTQEEIDSTPVEAQQEYIRDRRERARRASQFMPGRPSISTPQDFEHITHVFSKGGNKKLHTLEGLPAEWREALMPDVFGVDIEELESTRVDGYVSPIPVILVNLRHYLFENGGAEQVGIFRLAPDEDECRAVKYQLNKQMFQGCRDVNCIANLIKVWFRELPKSILSSIPKEKIAFASDKEEEAYKIIEGLVEPNRSIMLYLLDLISNISRHHAVNKMSPRNMAIVFAPNLYLAPADMEPFYALQFSQQVAQFCYQCVMHHMRKNGYEYKEQA